MDLDELYSKIEDRLIVIKYRIDLLEQQVGNLEDITEEETNKPLLFSQESKGSMSSNNEKLSGLDKASKMLVSLYKKSPIKRVNS